MNLKEREEEEEERRRDATVDGFYGMGWDELL